MMDVVYHNGELGYWTTEDCDCKYCPHNQEHPEFIPSVFGPPTKQTFERHSMFSRIYAPIIKSQLEQQISLTKRLKG